MLKFTSFNHLCNLIGPGVFRILLDNVLLLAALYFRQDLVESIIKLEGSWLLFKFSWLEKWFIKEDKLPAMCEGN